MAMFGEISTIFCAATICVHDLGHHDEKLHLHQGQETVMKMNIGCTIQKYNAEI
jgi:hypothetical protein